MVLRVRWRDKRGLTPHSTRSRPAATSLACPIRVALAFPWAFTPHNAIRHKHRKSKHSIKSSRLLLNLYMQPFTCLAPRLQRTSKQASHLHVISVTKGQFYWVARQQEKGKDQPNFWFYTLTTYWYTMLVLALSRYHTCGLSCIWLLSCI